MAGTGVLSLMSFPDTMTHGPKTLGQRLLEGRIPVAEALRYAMILADSIRRLHDAGVVHGAVSPVNISLTATGLELQPAAPGSTRAITPYTAPEVAQGRPADSRSDIFSFGAVLFEMLTGRHAFEGQTLWSLANAITTAPAPTTGSPAADRLLNGCLTKNPDARTARMQRIMMELKLLSVAVRRAHGRASGSSLSLIRAEPLDVGARGELQQLEARMAARLQAHERTMAEMQRAMADAVNARNDRVAHLERNVEEIRSHQDVFEHSVAADLADLEQSIKAQATSIESARTAMSQTDNLVERVVEALESLQSTVNGQGAGAGKRLALVK